MVLRRALPVILAATAAVASASSADREQELARVAAQRDALSARRTELAAEVRRAADRLAPGPPTARQLREFERMARGLDDVERRLAEQERRRVQARAAFVAEADAEERRLDERARREGATAVTAEMAALAAARRRVAQSEGERGFRPPLEIVLDPLDGPAEVEAKLAIVESERQRVRRRADELEGEAALLATRLAARREWARELGLARREAGGAVELLDVGAEDARASVQALEAQGDAIARERQTLAQALERLAESRTRAEKRLAELRKGR
jgi:chromosome segregation ATPase